VGHLPLADYENSQDVFGCELTVLKPRSFFIRQEMVFMHVLCSTPYPLHDDGFENPKRKRYHSV
jgi:hypothetical protein